MSHRLAAALDAAFAATPVLADARVGPFAWQFRFVDAAERQSWMAALLPGERMVSPELSVAITADPGLATWLLAAVGDRLTIYDDGRFFALWHPGAELLVTVYDRQSARALLWLADGDAPGWVRSRPVQQLIQIVTAPTPWVPVHAAAVGQHGRFLLLAGPGGSGKTTAALACASAGWDYAGDDFVLINPERGRVEPLYATARVRGAGALHFTELVEATTVARSDPQTDLRHEMRFGAGALPSRISGGSIAAIVLPRRRGAASIAFTRATAIEAYKALLLVSAVQVPTGREDMTRKLLRAVRAAPLFVADTGIDPAAIPAAFGNFMVELAG